jgi:hypothetical protein
MESGMRWLAWDGLESLALDRQHVNEGHTMKGIEHGWHGIDT